MSVRSILTCLGLALLALAGSSRAMAVGKCERLIATGNPERPPYLWRDPQDPQHLIGASADLLKALGEALEVRVEVIDSGKRAAAEADAVSGRVDLLADSYLTPARLDQFDVIHPAYLEVAVQVWARRDKVPLFAQLNDLAGHKGSAVGVGSFAPPLVRQVEELKLARTGRAAEALQQLQQGKSDYLLLERLSGQALVERMGLGGELQALEPVLGSEPLYLALSHNSACNDPWLRGQLAKKMAEFQSAGLPQTLLLRNLERWKNQLPATP